MKICAGIVSFNPNVERLRKNIESILPQVHKVFLVDNGSTEIDCINKMCNDLKVEFISLKENTGIAHALNILCNQSIKEGFDWILTLDQDSVVQDGMISTMEKYADLSSVGIVCPAIYYEGTGICTKTDKEFEYVSACMTSASLTNLQAFIKVGGFEEDYFIDYVDNEFCMKLAINGYKIIKVNGCILSHELGQYKEIKLFGVFRKKVLSHNPIRLYYIARNYKFFISKYKRYLCVPKELIKYQVVLFWEYIASEDKKNARGMIKMGIKHSKKKRGGKL